MGLNITIAKSMVRQSPGCCTPIRWAGFLTRTLKVSSIAGHIASRITEDERATPPYSVHQPRPDSRPETKCLLIFSIYQGPIAEMLMSRQFGRRLGFAGINERNWINEAKPLLPQSITPFLVDPVRAFGMAGPEQIKDVRRVDCFENAFLILLI
jgi:hypothetical protein